VAKIGVALRTGKKFFGLNIQIEWPKRYNKIKLKKIKNLIFLKISSKYTCNCFQQFPSKSANISNESAKMRNPRKCDIINFGSRGWIADTCYLSK